MQESVFAKELLLVRREEKKFLSKPFPAGKISGKLSRKVPEKISDAVYKSFTSALVYFMDQGAPVIDRTIGSVKILKEFSKLDACVRKDRNYASLRAVDRSAARSRACNLTATTVEGIGLGLLGMGLPDIPVFLGIMLKAVRETALRYGFACKGPWEISYFLRILCGAVADREEAVRMFREADEIAAVLDMRSGAAVTADPTEMVKQAAQSLAAMLLTAKFVQGIAVVGAAGGAFNLPLLRRLEKAAAIKYKQRYLQKLEYEL